MVAAVSASQPFAVGQGATAILAGAPSRPNHRQHSWAETTRCGACAVSLSNHGVVTPHQSNWPHGILPRLASMREAVDAASRYSGVSCKTSAPPVFHSGLACGANRSTTHTLRDKQSVNITVAKIQHLNQALSSPSGLAGFQTSEAANGRVPKTPRAFHENEGELPNVGG